LIILIILGEEYKSRSSSLYNFLHPPVTSSLSGPNILLSTLFSNSLCYSLNVRDQVSNPYRTTGKIIVLYILMFKASTYHPVKCQTEEEYGGRQAKLIVTKFILEMRRIRVELGVVLLPEQETIRTLNRRRTASNVRN
jgi:hypothetical protein